MDAIIHLTEVLHVFNENTDGLFLCQVFVSMNWHPFVGVLVQVLNNKHDVETKGTKDKQQKQRQTTKRVALLLVVRCVGVVNQ